MTKDNPFGEDLLPSEKLELRLLIDMRDWYAGSVAGSYRQSFDRACHYASSNVLSRAKNAPPGYRSAYYTDRTEMTPTAKIGRRTMTDPEKRLLKQVRKWMRNPIHPENLRVLTSFMVDHEIKVRLDALEARNASAAESSA